MAKLMTKEEFEKRVNEVHNNTLDLSDFKWVNSTTKGLCRCKECGNEWNVRGYTLLAGHGCRKCYDKRNSEKHKINVEDIQQRIYDLGVNVEIIGEYKDTKHKCLCRCKECGYEWEVCVQQILSKKSGCPKCNVLKVTPKDFMEDINKKYGETYDLSKLNYQGLSKKVTLIHPVYGEIKVKASKLYYNPKIDLIRVYVKKRFY